MSTGPQTAGGSLAPPPRSTVFLLGAIAALGSLATQLLVPALPTLAGELEVGITSAQLVVGVFLIGLGAGQLLVGPVADRMERRTLLLLGLAVYAGASLLGAFAGSITVLLAARLGQAMGSSAGLVTARVLLNSMVPPEKAVAAQASLMAIVLVSPALAPVIGGVLTELIGWRAVMAVLALAGVTAMAVVWRRIPVHTGEGQRLAPPALSHAYGRILRNHRFLAAACAMAFGSAALYVFLGAVSFLLEGRYHLSPRETGMCLLLVASASIAGTRVVARIERRADPLLISTGLAALSAITLAALSHGGDPALLLLLAPLVLLGFTAGLTGPTAISHVLAAEPGLEGTATSLAGALQMLASAFLAWLLGKFAAQSAFNLALTLLPLTATSLAAATFLHHRVKG